MSTSSYSSNGEWKLRTKIGNKEIMNAPFTQAIIAERKQIKIILTLKNTYTNIRSWWHFDQMYNPIYGITPTTFIIMVLLQYSTCAYWMPARFQMVTDMVYIYFSFETNRVKWVLKSHHSDHTNAIYAVSNIHYRYKINCIYN